MSAAFNRLDAGAERVLDAGEVFGRDLLGLGGPRNVVEQGSGIERFGMAPSARLEPSTNWLTADRSTN